MYIAASSASTMAKRILVVRPIRAKKSFTRPRSDELLKSHRPLTLSLSEYEEARDVGAFALKRGKLLESWRMCRVKKPWFCVAKEGYLLAPELRDRAKSPAWDAPPFVSPYDLDGLDRPLPLMFRPGLDQPPSGLGEGLRDRDMLMFGVPKRGGRNKQKRRE